jgi:hypothetical protein
MLTVLFVPSSVLHTSHAQTDEDFKNTILYIHNQERDAVAVPHLTWSNGLAVDALDYANYLTTLELTPDDIQQLAEGLYQGENLGRGITGSFSPTDLVEGWAVEKSNYNGSPIEAFNSFVNDEIYSSVN